MSSGRQLASCCFRPAPLAALHRLWLATTRVTRRARCNTYCACCRTCSGVCSAGTVELAKIAGASLFRTGGVSLFRTKLVLGRREPPRRRRSLARRSPIQHSLHANPRAQVLGAEVEAFVSGSPTAFCSSHWAPRFAPRRPSSPLCAPNTLFTPVCK